MMRYLYWWGLRITVGSHWKYNLPAPDHKLFEAHPPPARSISITSRMAVS